MKDLNDHKYDTANDTTGVEVARLTTQHDYHKDGHYRTDHALGVTSKSFRSVLAAYEKAREIRTVCPTCLVGLTTFSENGETFRAYVILANGWRRVNRNVYIKLEQDEKEQGPRQQQIEVTLGIRGGGSPGFLEIAKLAEKAERIFPNCYIALEVRTLSNIPTQSWVVSKYVMSGGKLKKQT